MSEQRSFTRVENELLPGFRVKLGLAESTEDVRKFFAQAMSGLLGRVFEDRFPAVSEDVALRPDIPEGYMLSARLREHPECAVLWKASDLPAILSRFAGVAVNRFRHLEKNPERTEAKMYPTPDRVGKGRQP